MKLTKELNFVKKCVKYAYNRFAKSKPKNIKFKTKFDVVTEIDVSIEKYLTQKIKEFFPQDKVYGEETSHSTTKSKRFWAIDPIDGTYNMTKNIPFYGVQCALIENGKIVLGFIYLPCLDTTIWAIKGQGCYFNGKRIKVSNTPLNDACVTFGDYIHTSKSLIKRENDCIMRIVDKVAKVRLVGCAAIDFGYIALGKTAGTVLYTANLWDITPGIIICKEAGAIVTNLKGQEYKINDNGVVVACSKQLSNLLLKACK